MKTVVILTTESYRKFVANNPLIEIVTTFVHNGEIVVTYKGQLGNPTAIKRRMV